MYSHRFIYEHHDVVEFVARLLCYTFMEARFQFTSLITHFRVDILSIDGRELIANGGRMHTEFN